jgi:ferredoxin-like protein FixX
MHLVGYLYEDYHDARSLEHKVCNALLVACCHTYTYSSVGNVDFDIETCVETLYFLF